MGPILDPLSQDLQGRGLGDCYWGTLRKHQMSGIQFVHGHSWGEFRREWLRRSSGGAEVILCPVYLVTVWSSICILLNAGYFPCSSRYILGVGQLLLIWKAIYWKFVPQPNFQSYQPWLLCDLRNCQRGAWEWGTERILFVSGVSHDSSRCLIFFH